MVHLDYSISVWAVGSGIIVALGWVIRMLIKGNTLLLGIQTAQHEHTQALQAHRQEFLEHREDDRSFQARVDQEMHVVEELRLSDVRHDETLKARDQRISAVEEEVKNIRKRLHDLANFQQVQANRNAIQGGER